jgi:hypothetical protein
VTGSRSCSGRTRECARPRIRQCVSDACLRLAQGPALVLNPWRGAASRLGAAWFLGRGPPRPALERDSSAPTSGTQKAGFGRGDDAHHDGG